MLGDFIKSQSQLYAAMVELADTRDLKSLAGDSVPVQVWLAVPYAVVAQQ